ncbi:hypothetical protein ASPZODRAFT_1502299 [Penicilliopsis zonata CBS 506.65]|uniref:Fungal N-terminal domain-containing protein n=1 Tax=Penicilliopsis zonata CBS 506.65 TaxID=1073090 RepID=A0A1L9S506_9EURO|nr:hypothetical protein ASPZODRAFT_1502299 [Penicilliopsis zonata CBS 506.65]OJJ42245.1 hypothetical protein ASPZODRAFT_1502299 [Penicilliopsis zonata CBS 506.65]
MAESLNLATSILAIRQLAAQITQLSYSYACVVNNPPKTQKRFLWEVSTLVEVLFRVERAMTETESMGLLPSCPALPGVDFFTDCQTELSALYSELQKRNSRFLMPFQDRELQQHIDTLHKFRTVFTEFISSSILHVLHW